MPYSGRRSPLSDLVQRYPVRRVPLWRAVLIGAAFLGLAIGLRELLEPVLSGSFRLLTYFPALVLATLIGGLGAGLTTLGLGMLVMASGFLDAGTGADLSSQNWATYLLIIIFGGLLIGIAASLRELVAELTRSQERAMVLAFEMKHRVGNTIGVANSISRQTLREATSLEEYQKLFEARMTALGHAQRAFAEDPDTPADLRPLIEATVRPLGAGRFDLAGPKVGVPHDFTGSVALLIHELGTNAHKYGALTRPEGRVAIRWVLQDKLVQLVWQETGGPLVAAPTRTGFGSRLLKTAFPPQYGKATIDYAPEGVRCQISFPAQINLVPSRWSEFMHRFAGE